MATSNWLLIAALAKLSTAPCPLQLFRLQSVLREAGIQVFGGKLTTRVLGLPAAPSNRYPHSCCASLAACLPQAAHLCRICRETGNRSWLASTSC